MSWKDYYTAITGRSAPSEQASSSGTVYGTTPSRTSPLEDYYNEQMQQKQATEKARDIIDGRGRGLVGGLRDAWLDKHGGAESKTVDSRGHNSALRNEYQRQHPNVPTMSTALTDDEKSYLQNAYADAVGKYRSASSKVRTIRPEEGLDYSRQVEGYRAERQAAIEEKAAAESEMDRLRKQLEFYNVELPDVDQNFFERAWGTLKGGAKRAVGELESAVGYNGRLATGGQSAVDRAMRATGNEDLSALYHVSTEEENERAMQMQQEITDRADEWMESAEKDIAKAKQGTYGAGRFAIEAGSQIPALAADMGLNALLPGAGAVAMTARAFGGGVHAAESAGADLGTAGLYGAANAGVMTALQKALGGLDLAYGKGFAQGAIEKTIARMAQTDAGRTALRTLASGAEQFVVGAATSAANPALQSIYNNKSVSENYSEADVSDWLYDGLMAAALGIVGSAASIATGADAKKNAALRQAEANTPEAKARAAAEAEAAAAKQAEAQANAAAAQSSVADILARGKVNQQQAAAIMNNPEFARAFEALTGRKLSGTTNEMRTEIQRAAREYAHGQSEQQRQAEEQNADAQRTQTEAERALSEYSRQEAQRDAEWTERRQQMENYGSYESYVRGLIRDGMTPAEAGEIARNPQMRAAWEQLTGKKLPTDSMSKARSMIMQTREDVAMSQGQRVGNVDSAIELMTGKKPATEAQKASEAQGDITTPPTPSNDVVARPEKLNSTANNESEAKGTTQPEIAPRAAPETSETPLSREMPPNQPSTSSEQPGVPGKQRERGFSENVRTDNAMEGNIRQSFDSNPEMYSQLSNSDTLAKARTIYEKGFQTARSTVDKALGAAKSGQKLAPEMVPLSRMVANELSRMGEVEAARNMLADVATELTAAGQLGQAARIMRDSDPNTALRSIERTLDAINEEFSKQHKRSSWKAELTDAERQKILSTDFTQEGAYESTYDTITKRIGKEMPSNALEKLTEIRRINMLLKPRTQIKNFASNVPMVGLRKGAEALSSGIQSALVKMGKMDASERTRGRATKEQRQLARDFYDANKGDITGQSNKWDMRSMLRENRTIFKGGAIEKALSGMTGKEIQPFGEALRKATYGLLEAGDAPFVKSAFVDSLAQYCAAKGITTKEGITREAIDFATANAMEATFKNANAIASMVNKAKRESSPAVSTAIDILIPFTTTPANIMHLMGDYSPIGFAKMFAKDGPAAKIDAFSKAAVGSAIMGLGVALRNAGIITGGEDDDKDKAALDKATGRGNYSIGGKVSYDWAQPAGSLLAFGAEIADAVKGQESWNSALMNAIYTAGDSAFGMSIFQNVISVLKGSGKPTQQLIDSILEGGATQLVPGLAGDIAKLIDGNVRSTYTGGNVFDDMLAKTKAATPFVSATLPESVNVKGETNTRGGLAERTFNVLLNPSNTTHGKRNEVDEEIYRLYDSTGSTTFFPSVSPYSVDYGNSTYKLDGKDREAFQKTQGQTYYQLAKPLLDSEMYKALSDEQKANVLNSIRDYALDAAKRQLVEGRGGEYSTDWDDENQLESPSEFIAAKRALSDGANGKSDNFDAIDQVLKNFGHLKDDTQTALRDSTGLYVDKLLYAESKGIKSKDWFDIYAAIKDYKKQTDSGSDSTAAIAVGNAVKGTDAEKLAALEAQLTPDGGNAKNPGKRNATVRRYEAAIDSGVSYDTWAKIEAALNEIAPGKTPNRNEIYAAAAQSGTGVKGSTAYWIYKKYSSDETKVEQYDYSYGNSGGDSTETNSDNSTSTAIKSWDDYMKFLGMTK